MLFKYSFVVLLLAQCLLAAPTNIDPKQKQLEQEAHDETLHLLNALFRAQIAYFSGVRTKLPSNAKRARDIELYVSRLNEAIAEKELDRKNDLWLQIFEQFSKSPLLINKPEETGLSNEEYQDLLTDKKLQEITQSFIRDVTTYFIHMSQLSGKVVENSVDEYFGQRTKRHE